MEQFFRLPYLVQGVVLLGLFAVAELLVDRFAAHSTVARIGLLIGVILVVSWWLRAWHRRRKQSLASPTSN